MAPSRHLEAKEESRGEEKSEKVNDAEMRVNPVSQILTPKKLVLSIKFSMEVSLMSTGKLLHKIYL